MYALLIVCMLLHHSHDSLFFNVLKQECRWSVIEMVHTIMNGIKSTHLILFYDMGEKIISYEKCWDKSTNGIHLRSVVS